MSQIELHTERLLLRSITVEDAQALLRYKSDTVANQFQGWIPNNIEDVYDFIKNRISSEINKAETWYQLAIVCKKENKLIGDIGIHFMDKESKQVEIGFTLDKNWQGKGYATEALKTVIEYLFQNLNKHRIIASVDPRNINSMRLLERLGFRKEAHFKKSLFFNGEWVDEVIYAILYEEWVKL
jgi:RimJ/RimL family protein N-acetyltransferase